MQVTSETKHSSILGEDMTVITYGHWGLPVLVFPTQDGKARQWEEFGMIELLKPWIDSGRIKLYCVDSIDTESWSDTWGDKAWRAQRQEAYFHYITDEMMPSIAHGDTLPICTGCSMGANHTVITFLRRPDLFSGCIAMSGVYDTNVFWGDYMDGNLYQNAPLVFLQNMPSDHPWIRLYNEKKMIVCVGQGAWEEAGVETTRRLQGLLESRGAHGWFDYWGYDVNHDWPWWKKQIVYFLPYMLED